MKLKYKKMRAFPKWAAINPALADKQRYFPYKDGIISCFDKESVENHSNHIEMSGFFCSAIISYRVKENRDFDIYRFTVFPSLRVNPNDTHGSLCRVFDGVELSVDNKREKLVSIEFNGILSFHSVIDHVKIRRDIFPASDRKALIEDICIECESDIKLTVKNAHSRHIVKSVYTPYDYNIELTADTFFNEKRLHTDGTFNLAAGENHISTVYAAENIAFSDIADEKRKRLSFINDNKNRLKITTPDDDINREILFAKLRASESIFETKGGLMHAPGGGNYYAALWTNDQCEYANPLFAYLGYDKAQEQSANCYALFSRLVSADKAVFTSICAEGDDYWHGAGDRGDTSMLVYGFARWLLTTGDKELAEKYMSVLETACEYIESRINSDNVVESDSDELENRLESGSANLSTAVISYDAFISMSYLEKEFKATEKQLKYEKLAERIRQGIENYFGDCVEGFNTYRYCVEESHLRSWICLPLTVGIDDRADDTALALKSKNLKRPCGLLSRSGEKTYWDRSLLYALRGLFYAGKTEDALDMLREYTFSRLYGEHSPYPIEAFPEGNGAHLSAESALYVRIFTEGILGFRPIGFNCFELKPSLPKEWDFICVENFVYSGKLINIRLNRENDKIKVAIDGADIDTIIENNQLIIVSV